MATQSLVEMIPIQYDFMERSEPISSEDAKVLRLEMANTREMAHNVRRGIFARLEALGKVVLQQREEIEALKKRLDGYDNRS